MAIIKNEKLPNVLEQFNNYIIFLGKNIFPSSKFIKRSLGFWIATIGCVDKDDLLYIFEIETADSIFQDHSHRQWISLYLHAKKYNMEFILVVPIGYEDKCRLLLRELKISAEIWSSE